MHFIFLRQCFYGLLLFNGFNANFTFKFGSKFSAACFTHPDRSFRLQISILFTCPKNGEYYSNPSLPAEFGGLIKNIECNDSNKYSYPLSDVYLITTKPF